MVALVWSPRATIELNEIAEYVAMDSPMYSRSIVERFILRASLLPEQPGQGRRVPGYVGPRDMHEVFVHRWRMIYSVSAEAVEIVTILHGARLIENAPPL